MLDSTPRNDWEGSLFDLKTTLITIVLTVTYFVDILWRSTRKPFWFDELFTFYLCRLPTMRQTWLAVQHGADFNPPLFYVLTRASQALLGSSNIATRMPATVGVWTLCFCLFLFVARRSGRTAGLIAAVFPLFTLAHYYAYEARPHGITLGWCGLALLCWQRIEEGNAKLVWHLSFIAVMIASVMTHVYAVYLFFPFVLSESYSFITSRRLNWSVISGLAIAGFTALPIYLPLMHTYRLIMPPVSPPPGGAFASLVHSATNSLGMSITVLVLFVGLSAWAEAANGAGEQLDSGVRSNKSLEYELVLATCFLSLPVLGLAGTRLSHAGYFDRYFLSWLSGVAILLGTASTRFKIKGHLKWSLLVFTGLLLCHNLFAVPFNVLRGREDDLIEPSSRLSFNTNPGASFAQDLVYLNIHPELSILDISAPTYIYFFRYAPADLVKRLYSGAVTGNDSFLVSYQRLSLWAHLSLQPELIDRFLDEHERFYTYESSDPVINGCYTCQDLFLTRHYALVSRHGTSNGTISEYTLQR